MNCEEVRQFLSPYLDSELDDKTIFVISRHLEDCPECALRFQQEQQLEEQISRRLRKPAGDEQEVFDAALRKAVSSTRPVLSRSALLLGALGFACALALFVVFGVSPNTPDLLEVAAADHQKYVDGELSPHVSGQTPEALKEFLRERVGVEVDTLPSDGVWTVWGVRLCHLGSAKVGLLMLRSDETVVAIFIVPAIEADKFPEARLIASKSPSCFPVSGGHAFLRLERDGTMRCAIGELEPENLEGLLVATR